MIGTVELSEIVDKLVSFRDARDWQQFHTIKNLTIALAIESAELLELVQWSDISTFTLRQPSTLRTNFEKEIADVLIYLLLICEAIDVDPIAAVLAKIKENHLKYPVKKSRGNATKYSEPSHDRSS